MARYKNATGTSVYGWFCNDRTQLFTTLQEVV